MFGGAFFFGVVEIGVKVERGDREEKFGRSEQILEDVEVLAGRIRAGARVWYKEEKYFRERYDVEILWSDVKGVEDVEIETSSLGLLLENYYIFKG